MIARSIWDEIHTSTLKILLIFSFYTCEFKEGCECVEVEVLPALSSPGTVRCDDHLSAVVCVCVVHIQLQALPLVALYQREQVLWLHMKSQNHRQYQVENVQELHGFKVLINYLIHNSVSSDDVVSMRPQASKGCRGIRLYFLLQREVENTVSERTTKTEPNTVQMRLLGDLPKHAKHSHWLPRSYKNESRHQASPDPPTGYWVWPWTPAAPGSLRSRPASWLVSPHWLSAGLSRCRCPCSVEDGDENQREENTHSLITFIGSRFTKLLSELSRHSPVWCYWWRRWSQRKAPVLLGVQVSSLEPAWKWDTTWAAAAKAVHHTVACCSSLHFLHRVTTCLNLTWTDQHKGE